MALISFFLRVCQGPKQWSDEGVGAKSPEPVPYPGCQGVRCPSRKERLASFRGNPETLWGSSGKEARYLNKLRGLLSRMKEAKQRLLLPDPEAGPEFPIFPCGQ